MNRTLRGARIAAVAGAVAASFGGVSCGDDGGNICPTGNCNLPGSTVVKWRFNAYPELGFDSDACSEVQSTTVRVDVVGVEDPDIFDTSTKQCAEGQATFIDLPLQDYLVTVTPLDIDGAELVTSPGRGTTPAGSSGAPEEVTVNVPYENWARPYTGQFLYRFRWDGMNCMAAGVATQKTTLRIRGTVSTGMNQRGDRLDGSLPYGCTDEATVLNAMNLPFGPATFEVVGLEMTTGVELFKETFDTFIGAGVFNPTMTFDVDATPDAGM